MPLQSLLILSSFKFRWLNLDYKINVYKKLRRVNKPNLDRDVATKGTVANNNDTFGGEFYSVLL